MQYCGNTQATAETLGVGGDGEQGLGRGLEQQIVDHRLVVISDVTDRCRQGEHEIGSNRRQEVGLAVLQPAPGRRCPGTSDNAGCRQEL